jgi:3-methyladenine DNA glycosylase AlkD
MKHQTVAFTGGRLCFVRIDCNVMRMVNEIRRALRKASNKDDAKFLQRFFRTGKGEYGEGDRFLGIRVPATRALVKQFKDATLNDASELLQSEWHEERLFALLLMVRLYQRGDDAMRRNVYDTYLANANHINNWDLVDASAEHIVGPHLPGKAGARRTLGKLARSESLWERRIAMLSTFHHIKRGEFETPLYVAELLRHDEHDLIHKAVGWMLREIGNRNRAVLVDYLDPRVTELPRTMLRYAIEKFPERERLAYLRRERTRL